MANEQKKSKFVAENKNFGIDWATRLSNANDGEADTINTTSWAITPTGLTEVSNTKDNNNTRAKIRVSGGTAGVTYTLENTIVLVTSGYTLHEFIQITVRDVTP